MYEEERGGEGGGGKESGEEGGGMKRRGEWRGRRYEVEREEDV